MRNSLFADPKSPGHIWADQLGSIWGPSEAVLIPSNRAQKISRGAARAMLAVRVIKMRKTNCQDWVFIRPPGTPLATYQLRMDTVWFCKVLLLFSCVSKDDKGSKLHECAYVSVLEEYKGRRRPGCTNHIKWVIWIICIIDITCIIFVRLAGQSQRNHALWAQAKPTSVICYTNLIRLGKTSFDPCGGH